MKYTSPIHIVEAKRSPIARLGGALKGVHAVDLAHQVALKVVQPNLIPAVNSVILGNVLQAGVGMNPARQLGLKLGVPNESPAFTVNMVCGSGMKAVELGATSIQNDEAELLLVGGVESMTQAPYYLTDQRWGKRWGNTTVQDAALTDGLTDPTLKLPMGETAENVADQYKIGRSEQDEYALLSQQRTEQARKSFTREIVEISAGKNIFNQDEHPRPTTTLEQLAKLSPAFRDKGTVTAGNSSGVNDGSALLLLANDRVKQQHSLTSRARIIGAASVGCDPRTMGMGPVGAIRKLCHQIGWRMEEVDLFEINEAFAAQTLGCLKELKLDTQRVNTRGGAIALGHPIGCSGARILVTLLHALEDANLKRGIASLCIGGGMGIAMCVER